MEWHGAPHKWPNIYGDPYLYRHHTSIYPKLVEAQLVHNKSLEPTSWWIPTDGKPNLCLGCCLDLTSPGKLGYLVYGKSLIQFSASTCFNPKSRSWDATSWNPHGPQDGTANTPKPFSNGESPTSWKVHILRFQHANLVSTHWKISVKLEILRDVNFQNWNQTT